MKAVRILELNCPEDINKEFVKIGVHPSGIKIMTPKAQSLIIKIDNISTISANVLKQEMLSLGGEVAVSQGTISGKDRRTSCILIGSLRHYRDLILKLKYQPWGLKELAGKIQEVIKNYNRKRMVISWDGCRVTFGSRTFIMGILNITPDSFSDGGKYLDISKAVDRAMELVDQGVDIIDIGGESTRPGAKSVSVDEELQRVIPVITAIRKKINIPLSIDTQKAEVAKQAIKAGADIINDVSALRFDPIMAEVVRKFNVPVILMHMKGRPRTMQTAPKYGDVVSEIYNFLANRIEWAKQRGIDEDKIIIDPGIGFGKTLEHNLEILRRLREFRSLGRPILIGTSRKSFIGIILNLPPQERLNGTLASCALAIANGADILRVHDVKEVKELAKVMDRLVR
ncbi:MAG: dihydropteroate synthase [Candidatus Omnitrophica bacterium]|nr:dihydropteroate synthase [Candidatus Omnitrophota bacterium]